MKKIIVSLLATLLVPFSEVVATSSAEILYASSSDNIEVSAPLDDLRGDEAFRRDYGNGLYNVGVATGYQVIDLGEYKYGTSGYALYLYVWNCEQDTNFLYKSPRNRVEIYNQKNREYVHLNVQFIQKSFNQFYKYKVEFDKSTVSFVSDNNDNREYSIVGFEAYEDGQQNAVDYTVGKNFRYSGYYYDETLECETSDLETLHLTVHGATYRTESSNQSVTARNDLYYVWFGVDKSLFTKYGNIYSIHCDYYDFDLSNKVVAILGNPDLKRPDEDHITRKTYYDPSYYPNARPSYSDTIREDFYYHYLYDSWDGIQLSAEGPFGSVGDCSFEDPAWSYTIPSNSLSMPLEDLNTKFTGSYMDGQYSLDDVCSVLGINFADIALNESSGYYKNVEIKATDSHDLLSYGQHHNGWENIWAWLLGVNTSEKDLKNIPAIERYSSLTSINNSGYIDSDDKAKMTSYMASNLDKDLVCFRFMKGVYDSTWVNYGKFVYSQVPATYGYTHIGFIATSYVAVLDFDIIDITFVNDFGEKTVLPVVASPINVWPDFENTIPGSGVTGLNWPKIIRLILIIVGIFVLLLVGLWLLPKTLKIDTSKSNKKRRK